MNPSEKGTPGGRNAEKLALLRQLAGVRQALKHLAGAPDAAPSEAGAELLLALDALSDGFLILDGAWRFIYLNPEAERLVDRRASELIGQVAWEAFPEAKGSIFQQQYEKAVAEQCVVVFEAPFAPLGRWFRIRAHPAGQGVAVFFQDITEQRRLEAFKTQEAGLLERIASGAPLRDVMDAAVRLIEEQCPASLGSILLVDPDGQRLRHGSSPRLPAAYREAIDGIRVGPSVGSCGTAVFEKRTVVSRDIATDPLWADYRDLALGHGLRACWSLPIFSHSRAVLGTFGVYYPTPRAPEAGELELVESCARILGIAIERDQRERQLRLLETSVSKLNDIILITEAEPVHDPGPRILFVNDAFERRTGYTREEVLGKTPRILQGPDTQRAELDRIRASLDRWEPVGAELINYTKSGEEFWLELNIVPVADASGWFTHWVAVERDITERKRVEEEIRRAAAAQARIVEIQQEIAAATGGLQATMNLMAERARELLGATGGVIEAVEGPDMVYRAVSGILAAHAGTRLTREGSLSGRAVAANEVLICHDAETDDRVDREACRKVGARSMIVAPLVEDGHPVGVLKVLSGAAHAFTPGDVANLQILAESLGGVLQRNRLTEQLRASEAQYRLLFEGNPHPMWVYDTESLRFLAVNDAAVAQYGYSRAEFLAMTLHGIRPREEWPKLDTLSRTPYRGRKGGERWRHRTKAGTFLQVEVSSDDIPFNGHAARLVLAHDVTARLRAEQEAERLSRAQRLLSSCNEALIRAEEERALLGEICRIAVDIGGYRLAWAGYAQDDAAKTIVPMAHAGVNEGYLEGIALTWAEDRPEGRGPAGRCIRSGEVVLIPDLAADPAFAPWIQKAAARGYRGIIALPLRERGRTTGTFVLYLPEVRDLAADEIALLQELADDLAFGIATLRSRDETKKLQEAVAAIAAGVSDATGEVFFDDLARNMAGALGADAGFVVRLLPGEPLMGRVISGIVDGAAIPPFDYLIHGTPCEDLMDAEDSIVPVGVASLFPASPFLASLGAQAYVGKRLHDAAGLPVGLLFVLFRKPLEQSQFITSTLRIFAGRAAMELGRLESDARIREQASLLDEAQEAILVRDMDHRIRFWNRGAEKLYGWKAAQAVGGSVETLLYDDPGAFREATRKVIENGEWNGEIQQRRKDGTALTVEGHWTLVRDSEGRPKAVLAINADITKRLALEAQLKQSQRLEAIGQLTGGVAHDFNNLLTVILGNSDLLTEQLKDQPRLHKLADMTRAAAQRGADLTQRLLAFGRRQALQPKAVDVNQLLAGMDGMLRRTLGEDIEIEYIRGAGLWPALVDPSQLDGAVLNLCINARDAMKEGGRLTLETANVAIDQAYADEHVEVKPGQYVMVAVSDTGTGIAPEHMAKVFDPFFTTKEVGKGTGLGLSMVYGFVKQSRGHIKLYSEVGHGTTVRMYLPRTDRMAEAAPEPPRAVSDYRGTEKVLLVEDNELVRLNAERQLSDLGYRVLSAVNGPDALEILREHGDIDLLFTDVVMPGGMSGRDLAVAALELRPGLKVLYTSGYTENSIVHHGRLDRGVHLLNKPYRQIDLARKLREVLQSE